MLLSLQPKNLKFGIWMICYNFKIKKPKFSKPISTALAANNKQVAQLWRETARSFILFSINIQLYLQNHARNWTFGPPSVGIRGNICALSEIFNTKNPLSRVSSRECQFYS